MRGLKSTTLLSMPPVPLFDLEASESTRMRVEESLPNYHEDHISGRGDNSLQH